MSGEITVTPNKTWDESSGEKIDLSKLNLTAKPSARLDANSVGARELIPKSITSDFLSDDIVAQLNAEAVVGAGSITTSKIANGAVTTIKLEQNLRFLNEAFLDNRGLIPLPWIGLKTAIPNGFAPADGGTYNSVITVDMRDANIKGAFDDLTRPANTTGGAESHDLTHDHLVSGSAAGHALTIAELPSGNTMSDIDLTIAAGVIDLSRISAGVTGATLGKFTGGGSAGTDTPHTHTISVTSDSKLGVIDNNAPYYRCFWMVWVGVT